jgi:hypothetical protein
VSMFEVVGALIVCSLAWCTPTWCTQLVFSYIHLPFFLIEQERIKKK